MPPVVDLPVPTADRRSSVARGRFAGPLRTAGPTWFVTVMGTGIVATATALSPLDGPVARGLALGAWLLALLFLLLATVVTVVERRRHGSVPAPPAPGSLAFWGTVPMAVTTVGSGALLAADPLLGRTPALVVGLGLIAVGAVLGVVVAIGVPRAWWRSPERRLADVAPVWLLAVVPPMVSAAAIGGVADRLPDGPPSVAALVVGAVLFGGSLVACLAVGSLVVARLIVHGSGPTAAAPTVFVVLGPLGQSVTAACLLGAIAPTVLPAPLGSAVDGIATGYGVVAITMAAAWGLLAVAVVARAARRGLPFALTWWSFTFPVGTCVTGTALLAHRVAGPALTVAADLLLALLVAAWCVVAARTAVAVVRSGALPRLAAGLRAG